MRERKGRKMHEGRLWYEKESIAAASLDPQCLILEPCLAVFFRLPRYCATKMQATDHLLPLTVSGGNSETVRPTRFLVVMQQTVTHQAAWCSTMENLCSCIVTLMVVLVFR